MQWGDNNEEIGQNHQHLDSRNILLTSLNRLQTVCKHPVPTGKTDRSEHLPHHSRRRVNTYVNRYMYHAVEGVDRFVLSFVIVEKGLQNVLLIAFLLCIKKDPSIF